MQINPTNTVAQKAQPVASSTTKVMPVLLAASVGAALLFAAGFAETSVLHNAAHDSRHSAVFPCH